MNLSKQAILDRLAELIISGTANPLEQLVAEVRESQHEAETRAKGQANNAIYRIARIERRKLYDQFADTYKVVEMQVEVQEVRYKDLPRFAEFHKINLNELQATLESRQKEVISGRDSTIYRAYNSTFVDRSKHTADMTDEGVEQADFVKRMEAKNQRLRSATSEGNVIPELTEFMSQPRGANKR